MFDYVGIVLAPLQTSLFASGPAVMRRCPPPRRTWLDESCWVDRASGWLDGADSLLLHLVDRLAFTQGKRLMWDNWVTEPRLTSMVQFGDAELPAVVGEMSGELAQMYGQTFDQLFTNYYRSGADGVAWHSDRIGREQVDPLVAIVSLGGPRTLQLRPMGGGAAHRFVMQSGDLLVMGGSTQHSWQHRVAKVKHASPRISLTMRAQHSRSGLTEHRRPVSASGQ